jgi:hypothetical protein
VTSYRWCGLTLSSELPLPELPPAGGTHADDWRVRMDDGRAPLHPGRRWFHHWRFPDGRRWLSFARHASGYLLRFPRLADFEVRSRDREIQCYRFPRTPLRTLRHLLLDQVLPLTVGGDNCLVLHASVVAVGGGAVAFLAPAGHGKSTLAATLSQRGCALVSDDCCFLRRRPEEPSPEPRVPSPEFRAPRRSFEVVPSYPGVRLSPASITRLFGVNGGPHDRVSHYSSKRRVARVDSGVAFCDGPVPLRQLFTMAPADDLERATAVSIRARTAREAALDLVSFTFHLDVHHASRVKEAFDLAADVAGTYGVRLLTFPWNLAGTDAIADAILTDLGSDRDLTPV